MSRQRAGLGTNQEAVRRHNLGTLLRHVHRAGHISRAELTSMMGLNRSTIAGLVAELESLGVTERALPVGARQGAGRPSAGVALADNGPYVIAVDLGVDRAAVARVGLGGVVQQRTEAPIDGGGGEAWQVGASVAALIRGVVEGAPAAAPLVGIGVSVPGLVRRSDGLIRLAPNLEWHDVSFGSIVLAALGLDIPVSIANDADLGALAEHQRGAGVGIDDLIYVSGNVGVGAGVITGGHRLQGAGGYAGELGHLRFNPQGRPCHCGNLGCWETEVGAHAIAEAIHCPADKVAQLGEVLGGFDKPTRELRATGTALGHGLASIVNAFNPRLVVLGGYFRSLFMLVGAEVNAGLADRALPAPLESVTLALPGLGEDSVLLGAAEIAFEPLFVDPVAALGNALVDVRSRLAG
ncbi:MULTISPECIES: ROK family protein [Nocardioides]|uniref:Sugar kinase of the NBD/HSP70 family, may contain an N-terminal HTH domain n=1 Tax=Nocardioides lianchengensis TaxID=1045774 RepID=A0A1G6IR79_9ACTN|nr:ROK family protein [Nocardioides lianchengensis]NYG12984.1 putative NBD/HSP70 family sugar kinase [Nocardioides lianchengensis]SDC08246.1 Sugar kinase of the NBD/HSP70 family, may contain an N-terminal HTH domain [Nocardioides lianchengensis]